MSINTEFSANEEEKLMLQDIIPFQSQSLEDIVIQNEFYDFMMKLADSKFTPRQKEVLKLHYLDCYTITKIGRLQGITRQTINGKRNSMQTKLVKYFEEIAPYLDLEDKKSLTTSGKVKVKR